MCLDPAGSGPGFALSTYETDRDRRWAVLAGDPDPAASGARTSCVKNFLQFLVGAEIRPYGQWHSFSDHCHSFKEVPFTPVWNASPMLS